MTAPYYNVFIEKTSFPVPVALQGTITTRGTTATILNGKNEVLVGDYIYDISQNEIRKIIRFNGDNPILEEAFTADITSAIELYVTERITYTTISVVCQGTANGELNGSNLKKRTIVDYINTEGLTPVVIDGTGTEIAISAL